MASERPILFLNQFGGAVILSATLVGIISFTCSDWFYGAPFSERDNDQDERNVIDGEADFHDKNMKGEDLLTQGNDFKRTETVSGETTSSLMEWELLQSEYQSNDSLVPFVFNYEKTLQQRHETMQKYSYPYSLNGVDKRSNLTLQEFQDVYDGKWPVIITDVVPSWPAFHHWNEDFFLELYGESRVTMVTQSESEHSGFALPLKLYLKNLNVSNERIWTYLQDEIFMAQHPELRAHVLESVYTEENFFNLFPEEVRPWDCMILWGTAHSRSTLHIDPYNWTGTNAVISGLKKWKLIPPGQDKFLSIYPDQKCGFPLQCWKYNSAHDSFGEDKDVLKNVNFLEVNQEPGEMLFIPTGWFHQAYNAVPTLAVSGQIMNSNNYRVVLEEIFKADNIHRSVLPSNFSLFSPGELVKYVISRLPKNILEDGAKRTSEEIKKLFLSTQSA